MAGRVLLALGVVAVLVACGSTQTPPGSGSFPAGGGAPQASAGCVDTAAARHIWTAIDTRLNQIVLDRKHQGLADVATGSALVDLQGYIQTTLVAKHLTEREVDRLDSLTLADAGCIAGSSLQLAITTTPTRDDYLKPDGSVDHSDPAVGQTLSLLETFDRVGSVWKESAVANSDVPTPSGQLF